MKNGGRDNFLSFFKILRAFLPTMILQPFPASLSGCSAAESECVRTDVLVTCSAGTRVGGGGSWTVTGRLDVFVFDDDALAYLDCYERLDEIKREETVGIRSSSGKKKMVALANCPLGEEELLSVSRYSDLERLEVRMSDEDSSQPIMSGTTSFTAGRDGAEIVLRPLMAQIEITSLDAGGLKDMAAYIVNAPATCRVLPEDEAHPSSFLNLGRARESDLTDMRTPLLLFRSLEDDTEGVYDLYCYPNTSEEESAGSPFSKLVIEGSTGDAQKIYSIDIGKPGKGVERGRRYSFDISIGSASTEDEVSMTLHPGNFLTGRTGESLHIWCEVSPPGTEVTVDRDDLEFDRERGIYDYEMDPDGHGVTLTLKNGGSGMFCIDAGAPVNDGVLVIVVVNP